MHVSTFGNAKVNGESYMSLYPRNGVLHTACALEWEDGLQDVFINASTSWRYESFLERCRKADLPEEAKAEIPLYTDGLRAWQSLYRFYSGYVDVYYADDQAVRADEDLQEYWTFRCVPQFTQGLPPLSKKALATQLTDSVFYVSAYHQYVGDVIRYFKSPSNMCWQIREGHEIADARSLTLAMAIACRTMRDMPEFNDPWFFPNWKQHLQLPGNSLQVQQRINLLLDTLERDLKVCQQEIDAKSASRVRPCRGSRPEFWACSVSL
jgi:hypothetical protein